MTAPVERVERRHVTSRRSWEPTFGPGMILGGLGALGLAISMFLPWRDGGVQPSEIPLEFLWDSDPGSLDPSLLLLLVPLTIILAVGAFVPMGAGVRIFGSIAVLVVAGLFAVQLDNALDAIPGADLGDALDTGFYLAVISAIIAFVSGLLPSGWSARRDVVETDVVDDRVA